jgi:hypothetical protein
MKVFLFLLPATMVGVYSAFERDKRLTAEERKKQNTKLIENARKAAQEDEGW